MLQKDKDDGHDSVCAPHCNPSVKQESRSQKLGKGFLYFEGEFGASTNYNKASPPQRYCCLSFSIITLLVSIQYCFLQRPSQTTLSKVFTPPVTVTC